MLKWGRLFYKVSIQNLEGNVVVDLLTGKILRSNQVWRSRKWKFIDEKQYYPCREIQLSIAVYLLISWQLKSLKFQDKHNYFQTHAAGFICMSYSLQRDEKSDRNSHLTIR